MTGPSQSRTLELTNPATEAPPTNPLVPSGEKTNAAEAYEQEHAEYVVVAPPADRTIYVLKVIMAKINEYCAHGTISTVAGR